jgi:DNA-binding beta-propeller fold protein YncE
MLCAGNQGRCGFEETRHHTRRRGRRARGWRHVPLAAVLLLLVGAVPAQADPTVYVGGGGKVFQYGINFLDESLSPLSNPTVAAGQDAEHIAVSPNGHSVYVTTSGGVAQYDVSNAGLLSPKIPATVPGAATPMGIAVTPDSNSLYTVNVDGTIFQYDVGAGGALSPKNPATVSTIPAATGLAVRPDGGSV